VLTDYSDGQAHELVIEEATRKTILGRVFQCNPTLTDTEDGTYLGDTKNNFIYFEIGVDIILTITSEPSSPPMHPENHNKPTTPM
jgi:hypothetical protein